MQTGSDVVKIRSLEIVDGDERWLENGDAKLAEFVAETDGDEIGCALIRSFRDQLVTRMPPGTRRRTRAELVALTKMAFGEFRQRGGKEKYPTHDD